MQLYISNCSRFPGHYQINSGIVSFFSKKWHCYSNELLSSCSIIQMPPLCRRQTSEQKVVVIAWHQLNGPLHKYNRWPDVGNTIMIQFGTQGTYSLLVPQERVLIQDKAHFCFEKQLNDQNKTWLRRDHSFEEVIHSLGQNSWKTQMKTTFFVMHHYVCEQLRKMYLCWYMLWWRCNIIILEQGHLMEWGCLLE